jgi:hypothetical protein
MTNTYKIYYRGNFKKHFHNRDQALNWIVQEVESGGGDFGDFEILDRSDEL